MSTAAQLDVAYEVALVDPHAHLLEVTIALRAPAGELPESVVLFMPVWTPGSYLVREYARHVETVRADAGGVTLAVHKSRKNAWTVATGRAKEAKVRYRLYANEVTVRTNHVDATHAFWNGAATYLVPEGVSPLRATVTAKVPDTWSIGTALKKDERDLSGRTFVATSLDELVDSPFECGPMVRRAFETVGREHELWVWSTRHAEAADWEKLTADTKAIVETEAKLLAGGRAPADAIPYEKYAFLWHVSPRGRGGLEHAASATLLVAPSLFSSRSGYLDVLSLVAHELLHLWNVKRIRPAGLWPYRYEEENHTRLLWWFEGGTSYFDWRILRLAGLATPREYAEHLAGELARLADTPGALVHALSDASFDAWIKAYRPDEGSLNSTVSYYLKGEVVCALLDIEIRARTAGKRGLDDVLRHLWWEYGHRERPVPEDGMAAAFEQATGVSVTDLFARWIDSAERVDPAATLAKMGLVHERKPRTQNGSLGLRTRARSGRVVVDGVLRGSAAMRAGIDPGDEILAIGGRRVDESIDQAMAGLAPGQEVDVLFARDGLVGSARTVLESPVLGDGKISLKPDATPEQRALLDGWLGEGAAKDLSP